MIRSSHRFHGRNSIQRLYKNGKMLRCADMSLRYAENPRGRYRVAVVVSRKVSKSAVVRNRIRRRVYENVRTLFGSVASPFDLLITVFTEELAAMPAPELEREVEKLLHKAGIVGR